MLGANISDKKRKALRNIAWAMGGKVVSLMSLLIVAIIVARYLGQKQYGIMNYVVSLVTIFQVFADFGLDLIQVREESRHPNRRDTIIGTVFALKMIFALVALTGVFLTVILLVKDAHIRGYILIYAVSIILNTTWVTRNHFTSIVWNEYVVKTEIFRTLIGLVVKVALVLLHFPLVWFICALVFDSFLLATGYTLSYVKKIDSIKKWRFDRKLALYFVGQSFPLLLSGAAIIVYNRIDQVMIGGMIDQSHLGVYSVAVRFAEILIFVPTIIAQTVSPMLVEARQTDKDLYKSLSRTFMNVTVSLCILLALLISLFSYPLVLFTFGSTYIAASSVLTILSFRVVGDALSQTSGLLIIIENKQIYAPIRNVIGCVACVILNLLLITRYGIHGAAYSAIITIFLSGTLVDGLIPAYRDIFKMQVAAIFTGWKDIIHIKTLLR